MYTIANAKIPDKQAGQEAGPAGASALGGPLAAILRTAAYGEYDSMRERKVVFRMDDYTRKFSIAVDKDEEIYQILSTVYRALEEKGYNPINQIVGYILSEDPTYITNHMGARTLIRKIDRDELLQVLVRRYLNQ